MTDPQAIAREAIEAVFNKHKIPFRGPIFDDLVSIAALAVDNYAQNCALTRQSDNGITLVFDKTVTPHEPWYRNPEQFARFVNTEG